MNFFTMNPNKIIFFCLFLGRGGLGGVGLAGS